MSNISKCSSCDKILEYCGTTYRCCDADVCSLNCSFDRVQSILKIDPTLTESHKWSDITPIKQINAPISFLTISQDIKLDNNEYLSEIDNYSFSDLSSTTICEMCDIYNKTKIYVFKKLIDFVSVET